MKVSLHLLFPFTMPELLHLIREMRAAQTNYFTTFSCYYWGLAEYLENEVDLKLIKLTNTTNDNRRM
jgi:hypothetical protein